MPQTISKMFSYHIPTEKSKFGIQALREAYSALERVIELVALPSRERSIALTNLETSAMFAIKAVVANDPLA